MCSIKKRNSRLEFLFFSIDGHNDFALNEDFRKAIVRNKIWRSFRGQKLKYESLKIRKVQQVLNSGCLYCVFNVFCLTFDCCVECLG